MSKLGVSFQLKHIYFFTSKNKIKIKGYFDGICCNALVLKQITDNLEQAKIISEHNIQILSLQRGPSLHMIMDTEARERSGQTASNYAHANCQVKSKYLGSWNKRSILVSLEENTLQVFSSEHSSKKKTYPLDKVRVQNDYTHKYVSVEVPGGRKYQIKLNQEVMEAINDIQYYHNFKKLEPVVRQLHTPQPKKMNYYATLRSQSYNQDYIPEHRSSIILLKEALIVNPPSRVFQRLPSYIKTEDWRRDDKKGGVVFVNTQKKSMISKMIKYIVGRVISTGSFMGISFPTFAMKPQTILQTYCKCLGAAPLLLDNLSSDPLQRMKAFNALILTISIQFNDIQKPFNPSIGQTFQGEIGGYQVYAEQISHHPPVTSFLLDGKNYVLYGSLELSANLSLNSAVGLFYGDVVIQFDDGGVIRGRMPSGILTGMVFGQTKFGPDGAVYSYDPINQLVCSYETKEKDNMTGYIGKLKPKNYQKFMAMIDAKSKQKYDKYKHLSEKQYDKILCRMEAVWTDRISYDNRLYFSYSDPKNLPIKMTQDIVGSGESLLLSDSSYRKDVKLRGQMKMEESQSQKQRIQQEERRLRKLRDEKKGGLSRRTSFA